MASNLARNNYHHGDLRGALLTAAKKLVIQNGPERVSLREVATYVGVSPSAVYHHFPDKAALLTELATVVADDLGIALDQAYKSISGKGVTKAKQRFEAIGNAYITFGIDNPSLFQLAFGPWCVHDDSMRDNKLSWQTLMKCLTEFVELGLIDKKDLEGKALLAWAAVHGTTSLIIDDNLPEEAMDLLTKTMQDVILN